VSFQVTILKVLAGQPEGYLSLAELRNNVAILISSGPDWTDRTKHIASQTPGLDIFSQGMVLRSSGGWRITDAGRAFLAECELPISSNSQERAREVVETKAPAATLAPVVGPDTRRRIWWRRRRREKNAARSSLAWPFVYGCERGSHFVLAYRLYVVVDLPAIATKLEDLADRGGVGLTPHAVAIDRALAAVAAVNGAIEGCRRAAIFATWTRAFKEARKADPSVRYVEYLEARKAAMLEALAREAKAAIGTKRTTRLLPLIELSGEI
jgi:hypothetical protein